jgi:hypothetical protein
VTVSPRELRLPAVRFARERDEEQPRLAGLKRRGGVRHAGHQAAPGIEVERDETNCSVPGWPAVSPNHLVAWWPDERTLHHVVVEADAPVGSVQEARSRGQAPYSPSLLNEARRALLEAAED